MPRRPSILALVPTLAALLLSLAAVAPVAAKEGMEARLDAPLSVASPGGSTMHVGWTVFIMSEGEEVPVYGSPVFIRLLPRGEGEPSIEFGTERPSGSGHYFADIVVPPSGIGMVEVGMRGSQCVSGVCSTSDMVFHVTGDTLATAGTPGAVVGARPPPPPLPPRPRPPRSLQPHRPRPRPRRRRRPPRRRTRPSDRGARRRDRAHRGAGRDRDLGRPASTAAVGDGDQPLLTVPGDHPAAARAAAPARAIRRLSRGAPRRPPRGSGR